MGGRGIVQLQQAILQCFFIILIDSRADAAIKKESIPRLFSTQHHRVSRLFIQSLALLHILGAAKQPHGYALTRYAL